MPLIDLHSWIFSILFLNKFAPKIIRKFTLCRFLLTKNHDDAGDWYVALGWDEKKAIIKMVSVLGTITEIKEI